jgi:hypothetical protein
VCTHNPFYVISAGLFLAGLRISFGDVSRTEDSWGLMSGLAGYLLLLAATACLLVRFGNVWEDVRTVLLLVVLFFLATSVTFDEVLILDPERGSICCIVGLLLAIAISEVLLRGIRLILPLWFRVPYYLILTLFFLYPVVLIPLVTWPVTVPMMWGLYCFSAAAGVVFLTLLPAIRRGPEYVARNGSPWRWPLYPWVLFGLLGAAVPARAFLLCWSMLLPEARDRNYLIFGTYFLVPFGLAVAVLLLEIGIVHKARNLFLAVLAPAAGLLWLGGTSPSSDPLYREFLREFTSQFGGEPFWTTLVALAAFYAYAAVRRIGGATEALTATLVVLTFEAPKASGPVGPGAQYPGFLLTAAVLQLVLGLTRRSAARCLAGCVGLVGVAAIAPLGGDRFIQVGAAFHAGLVGLLVLGVVFRDPLGRGLRMAAAVLALVACAVVLSGGIHQRAGLPDWAPAAYTLVMAGFLAGCGLLRRHRALLAVATVIACCSLVDTTWRGYYWLRKVVVGLDYIVISLAFFAVALLISLFKAGALPRGLTSHWPGGWPGGGPLTNGHPNSERVTLPKETTPEPQPTK